jgi:hypothetical protein
MTSASRARYVTLSDFRDLASSICLHTSSDTFWQSAHISTHLFVLFPLALDCISPPIYGLPRSLASRMTAEQSWYAALPAPKTTARSIIRTHLLSWLKKDKVAGKDFILVDLRRTDFEARSLSSINGNGKMRRYTHPSESTYYSRWAH